MLRERKKIEIRQGSINGASLKRGDVEVMISAGTSDDIELFAFDKHITAVLSSNESLGYAGLELIHWNMPGDELNDEGVFFQDVDNIECITRNFWEYSTNRQADILARYLNF